MKHHERSFNAFLIHPWNYPETTLKPDYNSFFSPLKYSWNTIETTLNFLLKGPWKGLKVSLKHLKLHLKLPSNLLNPLSNTNGTLLEHVWELIKLPLKSLTLCLNTYWYSVTFRVWPIRSFYKKSQHPTCLGLILACLFWMKSLISK